MKTLVTWLYDAFPGFVDYLPPALLYLGLWAVIVVVAIAVVAFVGLSLWWAIMGLLGRFIYVPLMNLLDSWLEFLNRLVSGKQEIPDPVHPVIQRVMIVEDRRRRDESQPID